MLPRYESRLHERGNPFYDGKASRMFLKCPFCGLKVIVYVWSFAGVGKKCSLCGAHHFYISGESWLQKKKAVKYGSSSH